MLGVLALGGAVSLAGSQHRRSHQRPHAVALHFRIPRSVLRHEAAVKRAYLRALHSRAARRARARSREAYRGLAPARALALLEHRFASVLKARPWSGLAARLPRGGRVLKYLDRFSARVRTRVRGRSSVAIVESLTPLLGEPEAMAGTVSARRDAARVASEPPAAQGQAPAGSKPVDLSLLNTGSFLAPASSATQVRIPEHGDGAITFPDQGLGVRVAGADSSGAMVLSGERVAYPSALRDTDLLVTPQDVGAELSWQARSAQSPRDVVLAFDLPPGAKLQASADGTGAVSVVSGGVTVASLQAPKALDGAGNPVPSSLSVAGDQVTVHVALGGPEVQFPVYVDPLLSIQDSYRITTTGTGQKTGTADAFNGWSFYSSSASQIVGGKGVSNGTDPGLAVASYPGTIASGAYGEYVYQAPANTFIQRTDFGYLSFVPANNQAGTAAYSCMLEGIYSDANSGWEPGAYSANIDGNPAGVQYGPNPMADCGSYSSAPAMPHGTFRASCVGSYDGPTSANYDGYFYNGGVPSSARLPTNPKPSEVPSCVAPTPGQPQGTNGNAAVFGMDFSGGTRTSDAFAVLYGADVYLSSDAVPTIDTPAASSFPSPASWVDSYQGAVRCDPAVSGGACQPGQGPVARDSGLGVNAESFFPPAGAPAAFFAPNQLDPSAGTCTGAPYHSPCPAAVAASAFGYSTAGWGEGPQAVNLYASDPESAYATYTNTLHVDHQAPGAPTFSGVLWDDRYDASANPNGSSQSNPLSGVSYPMRITGVDPGNASGPAQLDVSVDGGPATVIQAQCPPIGAGDPATQCGQLTGANRTSTADYSFQNSQYGAGQHTICVTVKDQVALGQSTPIANCASGAALAPHTSQSSFAVYTKPPYTLGSSQSGDPLQSDQLGLEKYLDYRKVPTGAGSSARVNLGNGNLVWNDVPVVDPGQGLSTFVEVTYNSQHRLGELAPLSGVPILPNLEYQQIGQGFSLGIDGLTRLNEPLDLSLQALGKISFTDIDGTRHTFVEDQGNPGQWISAPGVFLHLRQWSKTNGLGAPTDSEKTWAITRPDGTTFFFDNLGYESSIQDRHSNAITFKRDYSVLNLLDGSSSACSVVGVVQLPLLGQGACVERVTDAVDQGGRDMHVSYYVPNRPDPDNPSQTIGLLDPRAWRVRDIVDHAGRILRFAYDTSGASSKGSLTSMVLNPGDPLTQGQRQFTFRYGGPGDPNPVLAQSLPALSGLTGALFPPELTSIGDPKQNTTQFSYVAPSLDSLGHATTPCPNDDPGLAGSIGALIGTEPKCVSSVVDRGGGTTGFTYATGVAGSGPAQGQEVHTADVNGPRTVPAGSGARPDHWIDQIDSIGARSSRPTRTDGSPSSSGIRATSFSGCGARTGRAIRRAPRSRMTPTAG